MNYSNLIKIAFVSLSKNKLRTLLTMLGIIIGVGAVITMLAIGNGSKENIRQQIANLGTNVIVVFPGAQMQGGVKKEAGSSQKLTLEDGIAISENCSSVSYMSPIVQQRVQVVSRSSNASTVIMGVFRDYFPIRNLGVESGVMFTEGEGRSMAKVCLVGKTVVKNLFGEGRNPLGQTIRVDKIPFKIIGVLETKGQNTFGQDQDDVILAPFATVRKRMIASSQMGVQQILCSALSAEAVAPATEEITRLLRVRHKITDEDDNFSVRTQAEFASVMGATAQIMSILLAAIASISLLVGGIGIMNIMLVSVTERTREIGIRRAIGAKRRDVLLQFLIEAITLSLLGGLIGVISGVGISMILGNVLGWPVRIMAESVALSFFFSFFIGIFFGWYPSRKAARLNPIDALRYE